MTTYFTSDQHYWHQRICEFAKRPYANVEEMNEALVENHNSVVKPEDQVYFLGDFCFGKVSQIENILRRLNGSQKYIVMGNHDGNLRSDKKLIDKYFVWARDYAEIEIEEQKIVLCHYAFRVWRGSHQGTWSIHGHSHGNLYSDPNLLQIDAGVDPQKYFPISFEEVKKFMATRTWKAVDHHGTRDFETQRK